MLQLAAASIWWRLNHLFQARRLAAIHLYLPGGVTPFQANTDIHYQGAPEGQNRSLAYRVNVHQRSSTESLLSQTAG